MAGRVACMYNMDSSINPTQTDSLAFAHIALPNHTFSPGGLLHPDGADLPCLPAHGKVAYLQKACCECLHTFTTNSNLEKHASSSGHTAFSCNCGAQFSRAYTLTRHINSMIGSSFSCGLCDDKAFPRLDKLGDHLRRWHRPGAKAFDQYRGRNSPLGSVSPPADAPGPAYPGQVYPVAPGFGPVPWLNGFPPASDTAPDDAPSVQTSAASPCSSTAAGSWWYSQPRHNTG